MVGMASALLKMIKLYTKGVTSKTESSNKLCEGLPEFRWVGCTSGLLARSLGTMGRATTLTEKCIVDTGSAQ